MKLVSYIADSQLHKHGRLTLVIPPNVVWAEIRGDNVFGECILVHVAVRLVVGGEGGLVQDHSQHCIMAVVVASEVSCHTAVVENMQ